MTAVEQRPSPFVDVQEMNRLHPGSFEAPSAAALAALTAGDRVQVCVPYERFWVRIEQVEHDEDEIEGTIITVLRCGAKHGFHKGECVHFRLRNVQMIEKAD